MTQSDVPLPPPIDPAELSEPSPGPVADRVVRVSDYLAPMFDQAFRQFGMGERIVWEIGIQALPGPPAPDAPMGPDGQLMPSWETMLIVYAEIHGIVPDTRVFRGFPVMPHAWDQPRADAAAQQIIRALLEGRRMQLEAMQNDAEQAMQNRVPAPAHGLIVPG